MKPMIGSVGRKFIPRSAAVACALACASLAFDATLPVWAGADDRGGIRLEGSAMSSEGTYQFTFTGTEGRTYPVAVSCDLVHWSALTNVTGAEGAVTVLDLQARSYRQRFYQIGTATGPTNMVFVPPGSFMMGSPESEPGREAREGPQMVVTLSRGVWMGKFEVSQAEYVAVMGSNDSIFVHDPRLPAEMVSWVMATNYCHKLTERERAAGRLPPGQLYRLPTEAEWEYACRAGTTTAVGIGDGSSLGPTQANFDGNFPYGVAAPGEYLNRTTPVGSYPPNAWGLHDMHGNVWEWCQDWYGPYRRGAVSDPKGPATGTERVLRGGGFTSLGKGCRSAQRDSRWPGYRNSINGFRVVLAPED